MPPTTPQRGRASRANKTPKSAKATQTQSHLPAPLLELFCPEEVIVASPPAHRVRKSRVSVDSLMTVFRQDTTPSESSKKRKNELTTNGNSRTRSNKMLRQSAQHESTQNKLPPKKQPSNSSSRRSRKQRPVLEPAQDDQATSDDDSQHYCVNEKLPRATQRRENQEKMLPQKKPSSTSRSRKQRQSLEHPQDDKASDDDFQHDDNNKRANKKRKPVTQQQTQRNISPKKRTSSSSSSRPHKQGPSLEPTQDGSTGKDDSQHDDNGMLMKNILPKENPSSSNSKQQPSLDSAQDGNLSEDDSHHDDSSMLMKNILPKENPSSSSSSSKQQLSLEPSQDEAGEDFQDAIFQDEDELLSCSNEMETGSSKDVTDALVKSDSYPSGMADVHVGQQAEKRTRGSSDIATQSKEQKLSAANSIDSTVIVNNRIDLLNNNKGEKLDVELKMPATNQSTENVAAKQQSKTSGVDASCIVEQTQTTAINASILVAVEKLEQHVLTEKSVAHISAEDEDASSLGRALHAAEDETEVASISNATSSRLAFGERDAQETKEADDSSVITEKLPDGILHDGVAGGVDVCPGNHNRSSSDKIIGSDIIISDTVGLRSKPSEGDSPTKLRRSSRERRSVQRPFMVGAEITVPMSEKKTSVKKKHQHQKENLQSKLSRKEAEILLHDDQSNPMQDQRFSPAEGVQRKISNAAKDDGTAGKRARTSARVGPHMEPYKKASSKVPELPSGVESIWSFNEETRVLLADFRNVDSITTKEKKHLLKMMERDDISVVSWGLVRSVEVSGAFVESIGRQMRKDLPYRKFRRFDRVTESGESYFKEVGLLTMNFCDFQEYLRLKKESPSESLEFTEREQNTVVRFEKVDDVALYLADVEMDRYVPPLNYIYKNAFKMREILPGGEFCMMRAVPAPARPFMGPYLYLASGGFTSLHQNGHGTVDSGHTCLSGFIEVVLLRRLPEEHKLHAMHCLPHHGQRDIYESSHESQSQKTDREVWPTNGTVDEWKRMNYCPSVFILKAGQHLHINKGRLHCFRRLTPDRLGLDDCHAGLRRDLIQELKPKPSAYLCLSITFYWMFLGFTHKGIKEETRSCLECAELCRMHEPEPLKYDAIPETALLRIASRLTRPIKMNPTLLQGSDVVEPDPLTVSKGILTSLTAVVGRETANSKVKTTRASQPDAHESPDTSPIDPFGSDYVCRICHAELSNTYYHCTGCEDLLAKDMNICLSCYESGLYYQNVSMSIGSINDIWVSDLNHTGTKDKKRKTRYCRCREGLCQKCRYCKSCSCRCHHHFQQNQRFFTFEQIEEDLRRIEGFVEQAESLSSGNGAFVEELECYT